MSVSQFPDDTEAYRHTLQIEIWAWSVPLPGQLSCGAPVLESYFWEAVPQLLKGMIVRNLWVEMQKWLIEE